MSIFRRVSFALFVAFSIGSFADGETVTFEGLLPSPETFFKGNTSTVNADPWFVDGFEFGNQTTFPGFWSGWAYSNTTDSATPGFLNEHSAAPGGGSNGLGGTAAGQTYALAFDSGATFNLPSDATIQSVDWTNGTYPFLSMRDGDAFAKQFGGAGGNDPDFFRVILTGFQGLNATGAETGAVTLDLADYTFADNGQDFIVNTWQVDEDLTALADARSVQLTFESSDVGTFGINTPKYFFIDNLQYSVTAIPEPTSFGLLMLLGGGMACRRRRRSVARLSRNEPGRPETNAPTLTTDRRDEFGDRLLQ